MYQLKEVVPFIPQFPFCVGLSLLSFFLETKMIFPFNMGWDYFLKSLAESRKQGFGWDLGLN